MWKMSWASAQGLSYFHEGRNNQDAVDGWAEAYLASGLINDGCHGGHKSKNEAGAILSNQFLGSQAVELLKAGFEPHEIPELLYPYYLDFLKKQMRLYFLQTPETIFDFVTNHFLCTTVGLVADHRELCVYWVGDGMIYLNNGVYREMTSPNNTPTYPAYKLLFDLGLIGEDERHLVPVGFQIDVFETRSVETVGISSDGLLGRPELLDELKAHSQSRMSLQLCLNRIASIRAETTDNVSTVFAHNVKEK